MSVIYLRLIQLFEQPPPGIFRIALPPPPPPRSRKRFGPIVVVRCYYYTQQGKHETEFRKSQFIKLNPTLPYTVAQVEAYRIRFLCLCPLKNSQPVHYRIHIALILTDVSTQSGTESTNELIISMANVSSYKQKYRSRI